jgi:hypothetical protein
MRQEYSRKDYLMQKLKKEDSKEKKETEKSIDVIGKPKSNHNPKNQIKEFSNIRKQKYFKLPLE